MSSRIGRTLLQQGRRSAVGAWMVRQPSVTTPIVFTSSNLVARATAGRAQDSLMMAASRRWLSDKTATAAAEEEEAPKAAAAQDGAKQDTEQAAASPSREEELQAEVKDLNDKLKRSLAEQENTRRIAQVDVDRASQFAIKSFAKALLDTSDNLTRALDAVPEEMRRDKENHAVLANLYEGIDMTHRGLMKAFESNGLVKFGQEGESFDPNKHEALYKYVDPEKEEGTIGQLMKPGFMLHNRVLRPAEVGVIKKE